MEDKLTKLENKFETLIKQLERKLKDKINTVLQRGTEDMTAIREQMNALQVTSTVEILAYFIIMNLFDCFFFLCFVLLL